MPQDEMLDLQVEVAELLTDYRKIAVRQAGR